MRAFAALVLLALSLPAAAQRVGHYTLATNAFTENLPLPYTVIDASSGATTSGSVAAVALRFGSHACPGSAFKIKFFRKSGTALTMTAERGPFAVTSGLMKVALAPAVPVQAGDLIGVVRLADCAAPQGQASLLANAYQFGGDVTAADMASPTATWLPGFALAAYGAENANAEVLTHVIMVAGATAGSGGSSFKTDLSLTTLRQHRSQGRIVYHPAGTSGTPGDSSVAFGVEPTQSVRMGNFVATQLGRSGVGSVDVYTSLGFEAPIAAVRIYDDAGAAGTKGFTMDALTPSAALQPYENAALFAPQDVTRFRMNLGIRTLGAGEVQFLHLDQGGNLRALVKKSYPANYFIQGLVRDFTGLNPNGGDMILVYSTETAFFAYGSIIDNTTNDPSVQVARHVK